VTNGELTDAMELARHGAHTFHGLLTRTAATIIHNTSTPTTTIARIFRDDFAADVTKFPATTSIIKIPATTAPPTIHP